MGLVRATCDKRDNAGSAALASQGRDGELPQNLQQEAFREAHSFEVSSRKNLYRCGTFVDLSSFQRPATRVNTVSNENLVYVIPPVQEIPMFYEINGSSPCSIRSMLSEVI